MNRTQITGGAIALLVSIGFGIYAWNTSHPANEASAEKANADPGVLSADQIRQLAIKVEPAVRAEGVPVGSVPAQVSLPPSARVAVTAPFDGIAVQVMVLTGQEVSRGQPLAVVRAAEPVQFGGDLARAQADLGYERARANRLSTLAREGIVAGVRADEAQAAVRRTEATIAENRRLLALAGASRDGTATLRAPIAGRIATISVETGGTVRGQAAPFVIENTSALTLDLQIPERLAGQVRPGMPISVDVPGGSNPASGKVLSVAASLDPTARSISGKATLADGRGLVPGQSVTAVISDGGASGRTGVSVPRGAVVRIEGQDYVFVRVSSTKGGSARFVRRKVDLAAGTKGGATLSNGVKPGEQIVVSGVAELKSILGGE